MVEFKHSLGKGLVRSLYRAFTTHGLDVFQISDLKLTKSQYTNFAKLQYWNFVEKANPPGHERGGKWRVTEQGVGFLKGNCQVSKSVWTYRGDVERYEGKLVSVEIVTGGWQYKPQYAREAQPHE
jgi:hypothetical protein